MRFFCMLIAVGSICFNGASAKRLVRDAALEADAAAFVEDYSRNSLPYIFDANVAAWKYNTNLTDENLQAQNEAYIKNSEFSLEVGKEAKDRFFTQIDDIQDPYVKRQLQSIMTLGTANLTPEKQNEYNTITGRMDLAYSTAKVTMPGASTAIPLDPDLTELMATSDDYEELKAAWKGWFEAAGRPIKDDYEDFVKLSNEASAADGYADTGEYWRSWYEIENDGLEAIVDSLWEELQPMYLELHSYVRRKLYDVYGPSHVNLKGPIPAHLLGNMWAQTWENIYDICEPYDGQAKIDVTDAMREQGYDAMKMFKTSEEFFTSLGLYNMTDKFWVNSMIVKPDDGREVVCHASAWDFMEPTEGGDFRIKMCTVINMGDLVTIHHEMGHIQYYQQYEHQPVPFRSGANPGFHEAVGDTLALSVSTPLHLKEIGLLEEVTENDEADINYLLKQALEKIAFLPFGLMMDKWRWAVFDGRTTKDTYQKSWDDLRLHYQGIVPPVDRSDKSNFDPGGKYHIPGNTPYIRYFISFVVQFQFYESMCEAAGYDVDTDLYKCDFYRSEAAGEKLGSMLKLGASEIWNDAMFQMTGQRDMSTSSLQKYFAPLTKWLKERNDELNEVRGWEEEMNWKPEGYLVAEDVPAFLATNDEQASQVYYDAVVAEWNYNTDINDETQAMSSQMSQAQANFLAEQAQIASQVPLEDIMDPTDQRLMSKISVQGTGALSPEDLANLTDVNAKMQTTYSTAKVCDLEGYDGCVPLDPDLTELFATSDDYNLLRDAWVKWRDVSGAPVRDDYKQYVELENKAAVLNGYDDMGAFWRAAYETPDIEDQFEEVWQEMLPLYEQLHAYVRRKMYNKYGKDVINLQGPIPAHLFGNMWAQDWTNIYDAVEPFGGKVRPDATPGMIAQGWNVTKMFETSDKFFTDLGLIPLPQEFWEESMLEKPQDGTEVVCHASAWDFYNAKDFRIKMCTTITQSDLITIHHEMGHIQYFLQYKDQPVAFRDGANPGVHEAVGDTLALSVSTIDHLYKLGLIDEPDNDADSDINYLMSIALDKLAFIPFGYLMDKYRWKVFSGETNEKNLNEAWWYDRIRYQGVVPPLPRNEMDFDPAAKFHISNNVPYVRYFVSYVIQFQLYEAMCNEAGHQGDLFKCDFDGNTAAGAKLGNMLKLGSSVTWEDALEQVTGTRQMSSLSLVRYFKPLLNYLEDENAKNNEVIGWPEYSWQPPTDTRVNEDGTVTDISKAPSSADSFSAKLTVLVPLVFLAIFHHLV